MSKKQTLADNLIKAVTDEQNVQYFDDNGTFLRETKTTKTRHRSLTEIVKYVDWYFSERDVEDLDMNIDEYLDKLEE